MSVIDHPQERAWNEGVRSTVALMGTINLAVAGLVRTVRMLVDTGGWGGHGIRSVEHWLTWHAAVAPRRAEGLVRIARRIDELPACWGLFEAGRLSEDAMVRIARRVPAERDAEIAGLAPGLLINQLNRTLASLPELPNPDPVEERHAAEPQRFLHLHEGPDGWGGGRFNLPPDEYALLQVGLGAARDAELRDREGVPVDADVPDHGAVSWADGLVRMASEAADSLDATLARTGQRGERHKVVLHHDLGPDGRLGPGQLHLGAVLPDVLARYLACDAEVMVAAYQAGRLIGITPTERTVSRALRRAIERRDQGCAHPLCSHTRWLHVHHMQHWAEGGLTVPWNLLCLCPLHHRELHQGLFTTVGNPETGTLRFLDARGSPIEPPALGPARPLRPVEPTPYTPPLGERLDPRWISWN